MTYHKFKVIETGWEFMGWYMFIKPQTWVRSRDCLHYGYADSLVERI